MVSIAGLSAFKITAEHHIHSSYMKKALWEGQFNISKIELNALMTIFVIEEKEM